MRTGYVSIVLVVFGLLVVEAAWAQHLSPVMNQLPSDVHALLDLSRGDVVPDTTEPRRYYPPP